MAIRHLTHPWDSIKNWYKDPYRNRPNWSEKVTILLTAVIVGVAFAQLHIYRQQKAIMESSGQQTQKLIDFAKVQSEAASDMADAAGNQVEAAENFADTAEEINRQTRAAVDEFHRLAKASEGNITAIQEASRLEQRAWLDVGMDMPPITELDKPVTANFSVSNSGKTFALKVKLIRVVSLSPDILGQLDYYAALSDSLRGKIQSVALIAPGRAYPVPLPIPQGLKGLSKNVTPDWYITVWGDVTYRDVFRDTPERRTTFCGTRKISSTNNTFEQCAINNDAW